MPRLLHRFLSPTFMTVLPVLMLLVIIALTAGVPAMTRGTDAEAGALLDRAALYLEDHGAAAAPSAFSDRNGAFIDRDLYPFLVDRDGVMVAHGWTPGMDGDNVAGLTDVDGKPFMKQAMGLAAREGDGTVDYKWADPLSGQVAHKVLHVRRIVLGGQPYMLAVGVYR